jgi:serine protease Do
MPGIVAITNTSVVTYQSFFGGVQQYESESCGSGIIIQEDSDYLYIATNNHVVSGAETLSVQFVNDTSVDGEIQGTYAASDLAVVKVALSDIDSDTLSQIRLVTIGDSDSLKVGEGTIAIGNALGYGQSVTTGCVSALGRSITVSDDTTGTTTTCNNLIQTDAAINPGNSGGALLDASGALIGINSAKYADTDVEGIGYAIPINDAMRIITALIAGDSLEQKAYLGIKGSDVSSDVASAYGLPQGVYVKEIYEGSGAADAGICQGDIITAIDGTEISSMTELQTLLVGYSAGDTVKLTVWRMNNGYQSMEVEVTLSDASALGEDATTSDDSNSSNGGSGDDNSDDYGNGYGYGGNDNGFGNFDFFGW